MKWAVFHSSTQSSQFRDSQTTHKEKAQDFSMGQKIELLDVAKQYVLLSRNLTNQSTLKNDNLNTQSLQFCPSLTEHTKKGQNFSMGQNSNCQTSQGSISCNSATLQTKEH